MSMNAKLSSAITIASVGASLLGLSPKLYGLRGFRVCPGSADVTAVPSCPGWTCSLVILSTGITNFLDCEGCEVSFTAKSKCTNNATKLSIVGDPHGGQKIQCGVEAGTDVPCPTPGGTPGKVTIRCADC